MVVYALSVINITGSIYSSVYFLIIIHIIIYCHLPFYLRNLFLLQVYTHNKFSFRSMRITILCLFLYYYIYTYNNLL